MPRDQNKHPAIATLILLTTIALPAVGHETDQYTPPPDRKFADVGSYLTGIIYHTLERAVERQNVRIRSGLSMNARSTVERLQSPDRIAEAVNEQFPPALFLIESLDSTVTSDQIRAEYPGRVVGYKPVVGIRKNVDVAFNPFRAWACATINAYGVFMGTDKLGHFADMGMHYYTTYRDHRRDGASDEKAQSEMLKLGTEDPVYSERGLLGLVTAGAYSNADLASNYMGFLFYRNLTEPVTLKGCQRPPMIVRDGELLKLADHVRPDSDFFSWFISDHLNESLNPSVYRFDLRPGIRTAIVEFRKSTIPRYADANGNLHSPEHFASLTRDLSTYWGVPYGHDGDKELIRLSEYCFAAPPDMSKPTVANADGLFPLHYAAMRGDVAAIEAVLTLGADVNAKVTVADSVVALRGDTPLHLAAREGKLEAVRLLLAHRADVNAINDRAITPLHMSVRFAGVAAALCDGGADVNPTDERRRTPLHWAANDPAASASAVLIARKADPSPGDREGLTPLHLAARAGHITAIQQLAGGGAEIDARDRLNRTPLHLAALAGESATRQVLAAGASVESRDDFGCTPLHVAVRAANDGVVALLLVAGANPSTSDGYGQTGLAIARRNGLAAIAERLQRPIEPPQPPIAGRSAIGH